KPAPDDTSGAGLSCSVPRDDEQFLRLSACATRRPTMSSPDKEPELMQKIVSLCKRRGFVFQSSEIYGGLKSAYDYGPMGVELKRNLMNEWWTFMVTSREDVVGLESSIIMHPDVWRSSGHVG